MGLGRLVGDGDCLFVSTGTSEPRKILDALVGEIAPLRRDLTLLQVLLGASGRSIDVGQCGHRVLTVAPYRWANEAGVEVLYHSMNQLHRQIGSGELRIDGALLGVARCGDRLFPVPATDLTMKAIEMARYVAVEVQGDAPDNLHAPSISTADVDLVVEGDPGQPIDVHPLADPISERIGQAVAEVIPENGVLQLGVGRALAGVADGLIARRRQVRIHTGLASDWAMKLVESGLVERGLPCAGACTTVASVAMGSDEFARWVLRGDTVAFEDSHNAHDPSHLAELGEFVAVNSAMAVTLDGSAGIPQGASALYGPGGLLDFAIAGAYGGRSIIALQSRSSAGHDRIVPALATTHLPGSLVTHVVTEFGSVDLTGKTRDQRRELLIGIAHPDSRDRLLHAAY